MPPVKSAHRLYTLCVRYLQQFLVDVGTVIFQKCGPYSNLQCQILLQTVQDYLLFNLHPYLLDELLNTLPTFIHIDGNQRLMLLAIYMHHDMKVMSPKFKLPVQDEFYEIRLKYMSKLVALDLTMVCTDEILEIVGNNCQLLEEICIVSKTESATNKSRKELNALKLKLFVSDQGLEHIHKCKKLKRIIMNKLLRSNCSGRKVTHDGIRKLLRALPKLQYISYSDMGLVLEKGFEDLPVLNLNQLHDNHINPGHIDIYNKFCPNLKRLCLQVPTVSFGHNVPSISVSKLTKSCLELTSLDLGFFPFDKSLENFLEVKGQFLKSFSIIYGSTITLESLSVLGKYCPNLVSLEVKILQSGNNDRAVYSSLGSHNYFSELINISLFGVEWDPSLIFPLCIFNAKNLEKLALSNKDYAVSVDSLIVDLLTVNPLVHLKEACLHYGFIMSCETLRTLLLSCHSLINFSVRGHSNVSSYLEDFKALYNFDINIHCDDTLTHCGNCFRFNRCCSA